jgi:enoyl-CoA hydratase/carnithine racemase
MFVSVDNSDGITVICVDRPPANAISVELMDELVAVLEGLAAQAPAGVVIAGPEALRLGLFDEVIEAGAVFPRAVELAAEMAAFPADVYAATKRELRSQPLNTIKAAVESEPLLERWL